MAEKKRSFNIVNIFAAKGGGFAANLAMEALETKVEAFQKKPILSPLAMDAVGAGMAYFGSNGKTVTPLEAAGYGILGAGGSEMANLRRDKLNGFSRVSYGREKLSLNAAELDALEDEESEDRMNGWQDEEGYDN